MNAAVVFLLDPSLSGAVEQLERELGLALEHGHEPAFDDGPEGFLFAVLLGALRQSRCAARSTAARAPHVFRRRAWRRRCR